MTMSGPTRFRPSCPYCFSPNGVVDVHGHLQCVDCKMNVDPCCGGDASDPVADDGGKEGIKKKSEKKLERKSKKKK